MKNLLLLGGIGIVAYFLLKRKSAQETSLQNIDERSAYYEKYGHYPEETYIANTEPVPSFPIEEWSWSE